MPMANASAPSITLAASGARPAPTAARAVRSASPGVPAAIPEPIPGAAPRAMPRTARGVVTARECARQNRIRRSVASVAWRVPPAPYDAAAAATVVRQPPALPAGQPPAGFSEEATTAAGPPRVATAGITADSLLEAVATSPDPSGRALEAGPSRWKTTISALRCDLLDAGGTDDTRARRGH